MLKAITGRLYLRIRMIADGKGTRRIIRVRSGCEITTFRIKWQRDTYGSESRLIVSQHRWYGDYNGM